MSYLFIFSSEDKGTRDIEDDTQEDKPLNSLVDGKRQSSAFEAVKKGMRIDHRLHIPGIGKRSIQSIRAYDPYRHHTDYDDLDPLEEDQDDTSILNQLNSNLQFRRYDSKMARPLQNLF